MGCKNIVLEIEDYELLEWHECWMGGKNTTFNVRDYELHEWSECWMGQKEYSLENVRLRITRMALMVGMRKAHSLTFSRLYSFVPSSIRSIRVIRSLVH